MPLKPAQLYLLFFSLYWAQGLPVGFMTQALPVILRMQGVSLAHIGGFGLLMFVAKPHCNTTDCLSNYSMIFGTQA